MPSLRELQQSFAAAVMAPRRHGACLRDRGIGACRRPHRDLPQCRVRELPQCARASFPVVLRLVGEPFFNAAVDAFVQAHPSVSGDLNVYGDSVRRFSGRLHARRRPAVSRRRRAPRVGDRRGAARGRWRCLRPTRVWRRWRPRRRSVCPRRAFASIRRAGSSRRTFRILRIWQANQPGREDDDRVSLDEGADTCCRAPRRRRRRRWRASARASTRFSRRWRRGAPLGAALDAAQRADAAFDLGARCASHRRLRRFVGNRRPCVARAA